MKTKKKNRKKISGQGKILYVDILEPGFSKTRQIANNKELKNYKNDVKKIKIEESKIRKAEAALKKGKLNKKTLKQRLLNFFKRKKRQKSMGKKKNSSLQKTSNKPPSRPRLINASLSPMSKQMEKRMNELANQTMSDSL